MRKPYLEILADAQYEALNNSKELGLRIAEFFEKIVVWLIGLSTGSIILIFKEIDKLNYVSQLTINITLILLVLAILAGILGRILYAIAIYIGYSFMSSFLSQLKMFGLPKNNRSLSGAETQAEIILLFQEDFNIDVSNILEKRNETVEFKQEEIDFAARKFYETYSALVLKLIQDGKQEVFNIYLSTFGQNETYFKKRENSDNKLKGKFHRTFTFLSFVLYLLSAALFGSAVCYFVFAYISNIH